MRLLNKTGKQRPVSTVPYLVRAALLISLSIQILWSYSQPAPVASAVALPEAPDVRGVALFGFGDSVTQAKLLMLWLQAFDNQPGISIPFKDLNYDRVINWLEVILKLDNKAAYPLLSASRLYTETPDDDKKRLMLEYVYEKFLADPVARWPWMAHAVYVAKHRIGDLQLALKYARALRLNLTIGEAPHWVVQMEIYVLEELGEIESAKIIIGGLLESGKIAETDTEYRFLENRLAELQAKETR